MKIFAFNLCLSFEVFPPDAPYIFEPFPLTHLLASFEGETHHERQFYIALDGTEDEVQKIFDWQAVEAHRQVEASICFYFDHEEIKNGWLAQFQKRFKAKIAAGGMVRNEQGEYLCIYTRDRWTLPKGMVEKGEHFSEAAQREVEEETGLRSLELLGAFTTTYHTFCRRDTWCLKATHWFRMKGSKKDPLIPQADEYIEAVQWVSRKEWERIASQSYPLNRALFEAEFAQALHP